MIEGIYNIKPKDILASIALEKTEKNRAKRESIAIDNESPDRSPRHQGAPRGSIAGTMTDPNGSVVKDSIVHGSRTPANLQSSAYQQDSPNRLSDGFSPRQINSSGTNMLPNQGFAPQTNRGGGSNERMQDMMRNKQKRKKRRNTYHKPDRGGNKVIVEPFDIQPPKEFKEINNTRKVHYPMMLQKYNCEKVMPWNLDDFRYAMLMIVRTDNDEVFNEHL